ncbi:hypothetical protein SDC9_156598 [bioreactor metagenome]|uniref:Uncharacterized protein n=1 Tax=bioreactor metagenome TaxID=1076179 RepID=A0A645F7I9_9ZZZZ
MARHVHCANGEPANLEALAIFEQPAKRTQGLGAVLGKHEYPRERLVHRLDARTDANGAAELGLQVRCSGEVVCMNVRLQ